MGEYLAADVYSVREAPRIPTAPSLPTSVTGVVGVTERGPIAVATLVSSFEEFTKIFGGFTANADAAIAAYGFFKEGGAVLWVVRTCHFTDITNPASAIATKATLMLKTAGGGATAGSLESTNAGPFELAAGDTLDISTNAGGPTTATFLATRAKVVDTTTYPVVAGTGVLSVKVDREPTAQDITFAGTETTADDVVATINAQLERGRALVVGGQIQLESDTLGTGSFIQVTANPTANPLLTFPTTEVQGTGNVEDIRNVTGAEVKTIVEAAVADVDVTVNPGGTVTLATDTTGSTKWVRVEATSTADGKIGLDNLQHTGTDDAPQDTLKVDAKTEGEYGDSVSIITSRATSDTTIGATDPEFNFQVLKDGVVEETFPNVNMDNTSTDFVETVVNHATAGSNLVAVTDQGAVGTQKPDIGSAEPYVKNWGAMSGGDDGLTGLDDNDFLGSDAGPTGMYALDAVQDLRILAIPGRASGGLQTGMVAYCEVWREGAVFPVLDPPDAASVPTSSDMVNYLQTAGLSELSEFGAIYWPRIKIVNPSKAVFGQDDNIVVPPSAFIAGVYARNDQREGGVYNSPAGVDGNAGVIFSCTGLEVEETLNPKKVRIIYPKRINPILRLTDTPFHMDGGRTLKSTGSFPHIGQSRGAIHIEQTLKRGLVWAKHRYNNEELRNRAKRYCESWLRTQLNLGAFASRKPAEAFYVDVSNKLNPPSVANQGQMRLRIGVAFATPAEFIIIYITADTRALEESLAQE